MMMTLQFEYFRRLVDGRGDKASGKPIYCVMKGEVADLVIKNKIGFVAHPDNIDDIKAGFEKFLSAPKHELQAFGSNMKSLLANEYDRDKIIGQMTQEIFV